MVAGMGGLDVLSFSGGIGGHDAVLRAQVCERLGWLGVKIDTERNALATQDSVQVVHAPGSSVEIWVVPTDEGRVAAREAAHLLHQGDDAIAPAPVLEMAD